jgi:hypothetical protein
MVANYGYIPKRQKRSTGRGTGIQGIVLRGCLREQMAQVHEVQARAPTIKGILPFAQRAQGKQELSVPRLHSSITGFAAVHADDQYPSRRRMPR